MQHSRGTHYLQRRAGALKKHFTLVLPFYPLTALVYLVSSSPVMPSRTPAPCCCQCLGEQ